MASEPEPSPIEPLGVTWRLRVDDARGTPLVDRVLERRRYSLGRDKRCDLCLPAREVSREHAALECDESGRWWLVDLGSTSGTVVNGRLVNGRRALSPFDVAYVGEYRIELHVNRPPSRPAILLAAERSYEAPARVRVCDGPLAGRDMRLDRGRVVIGEGPDSSLSLGGEYAGVRVVIRPLKDGSYEVSDESASPSLTVDGRPAVACRLDTADVALGLGAVERQRANPGGAFCVRYMPSEHLFDEATPAPIGALRLGAAAANRVLEQSATSAEAPSPDDQATPSVEAAPVAFDDVGSGGLSPWPDLSFGEKLEAGGVRTVELKRPPGLGASAATPTPAPVALVATPTPAPVVAAPAAVASNAAEPARRPESVATATAQAPPQAANAMDKTIVRKPPEKERNGVDDVPLSLSTFVRQLEAARRPSPDAPGEGAAEPSEAFDASPFNAEPDVVNRTLKLSEPGWPAQREALRARAEAAPRHRWLPIVAFVLLALASLAPLLGRHFRGLPGRAAGEGVPSIATGSSTLPAVTAPIVVAPEPTTPPPAAASERVAPPKPLPARGARSGRGGTAEGPLGDGAEPRKRSQEICKRPDCSR